MSKRRRYHAHVACDACGRVLSDEQLADHQRVCPAWRKRVAEDQAEQERAKHGDDT